MRGLSISIAVSAAFFLFGPVNAEPYSPHASVARRHMHGQHKRSEMVKHGQCQFPTDAGLVAVTPGEQNAGWAMSPDQPCKPGMYCPYACPPGQLMAQWDPSATTYSYPESMNGGLYCDTNGQISKPFPNKPYCYDGTGSFNCKNIASDPVALCQTVLPGNEAMLIPTVVSSSAVLAVPDTSYWAETAAHYYINPPGVSAADGCVWGSKHNPYGNWSPYVTGANQVESGETFVKIGWNPIYIEPDVPFRNTLPDWGVKIECSGGTCGGLPCYIDPAEQGVNEISQGGTPGAGGATFCVVSVPKGAQATLIVFSSGSGSSSGGSSSSASSSGASSSSTSSSSASSSSASSSSTSSSSASSSSTPSSSASSSTTKKPSASLSASPSSSFTTTSLTVSSSSTSALITSTNKPKSSSSSSFISSTMSSSSEPSSTTNLSSSTGTDLSSSTKIEEPTATPSNSYNDNGDGNDGQGDGGSTPDDYTSNPAELFVVSQTSTSSTSQPTSGTADQVVGAVSNNNDAAVNAQPNVNSTGASSSSGVSLSFPGASAVLICSVFAVIVMAL